MGVYIGGVEAGLCLPEPDRGLGPRGDPPGLGPDADLRGPAGILLAVLGPDPQARAVAQGHAAALDAIRQAAGLGMGRGTPVYYDMEAYHGRRRCKDATLAFLDAWTRTLHAHGYSSGVYSSASSGAENLGWAHRVHGHKIAKPDSMWFGLWDNEQNVRGLPYLLHELVAGAAADQAVRGPAPAQGGRVQTGHRLRLGLRGCLPVIGWSDAPARSAAARRPPTASRMES